jgi:hypothetical protein
MIVRHIHRHLTYQMTTRLSIDLFPLPPFTFRMVVEAVKQGENDLSSDGTVN